MFREVWTSHVERSSEGGLPEPGLSSWHLHIVQVLDHIAHEPRVLLLLFGPNQRVGFRLDGNDPEKIWRARGGPGPCQRCVDLSIEVLTLSSGSFVVSIPSDALVKSAMAVMGLNALMITFSNFKAWQDNGRT